MDLDMPFELGYGSLVGPVSLKAATRRPGCFPFELQTGTPAQASGSNQSIILTYRGLMEAAHKWLQKVIFVV